MLSEKQRQLFAETLSNIGVVMFGSAVVPILFGSLFDFASALGGFALALSFWLASLRALS